MENYKLQTISLKDVKIRSNFWDYYLDLVRTKVLPYQWKLLNDLVPGVPASGSIKNFRIAAKYEEGRHTGMAFQDSDVAKWLEAVGNVLACTEAPDLERNADATIDIIASAQQEDGYLNTFVTIEYHNGRLKNLLDEHELYCAGHLIEAAIAYFKGTQKPKFLYIARRVADNICDMFGKQVGQLPGYPGHQEIEQALIKLYELTHEKQYLDQAKYFISIRGTEPHYFDEEQNQEGYRITFPEIVRFDRTYAQTHIPVRDQTTAEGHAVRAVYQYTAMAGLARLFDDVELHEACKKIFHNITQKRMYVTGGIGSSSFGERFTIDYDLPNDSGYTESCASIGLIRFVVEMARIHPIGEYYDIVERALYNTVLSGLSLSGDRFFYVNPLEVEPERCKGNRMLEHVKPIRQPWFGVACCPPNIARTIAGLGEFVFSQSEDTLFVHMYITSTLTTCMLGGMLTVSVESTYPSNGDVTIKIVSDILNPFTIAVRIPQWCTKKRVSIDGFYCDEFVQKDGYILLKRVWNDTVINLENSMQPFYVYANTKVSTNCKKATVQRGPFIYCVEEVDNGSNLGALVLPPSLDGVRECFLDKIPSVFPSLEIQGIRL